MNETNETRAKRYGRPASKNPRTHCVSVRLNDEELALLNNKRGNMKQSKWLRCAVIAIATVSTQAHAGMPVFDASNFGQAIQQVQQGVQQLQGQAQQLVELKNQVTNQLQQIQQLKDQLTNLSGVSNIGNLAQSARNTLPQNLSSASSFGNSGAIQSANKITDLSSTSIDPNSTAGQLYTKQREQAAVNLAAIEASYQASYERINNLQSLVSQIEQSPSAKNIADLTARIQAEQAFLQNEANQLAAMAQMQNVQKTINEQKAIENNLKATQSASNHKWGR